MSFGRVKTNMPNLDGMLGGGLRFGLHCITGGPGSYKTAMLLQLAELARMDGFAVEYIADETGLNELCARLVTRKMRINELKQVLPSCGDYSWSEMEHLVSAFSDDRTMPESKVLNILPHVKDASRLISLLNDNMLSEDEVRYDVLGNTSGILHIADMGGYLSKEWTERDAFEFLFCRHNRYFTSTRRMCEEEGNTDNIFDSKLHGGADLIIIDPVNALRTCEWKGHSETVRDNTPESKRALLETLVEELDNFGRETNTAVMGVFYGNRTNNKIPQHPSMADFKETSAIEYRAVSAWELVRADDMRWSNHPKAPDVPKGMEAVGLFLLKSRGGQRTEHNKPIWMAADGAHNLIVPLDTLRK